MIMKIFNLLGIGLLSCINTNLVFNSTINHSFSTRNKQTTERDFMDEKQLADNSLQKDFSNKNSDTQYDESSGVIATHYSHYNTLFSRKEDWFSIIMVDKKHNIINHSLLKLDNSILNDPINNIFSWTLTNNKKIIYFSNNGNGSLPSVNTFTFESKTNKWIYSQSSLTPNSIFLNSKLRNGGVPVLLSYKRDWSYKMPIPFSPTDVTYANFIGLIFNDGTSYNMTINSSESLSKRISTSIGKTTSFQTPILNSFQNPRIYEVYDAGSSSDDPNYFTRVIQTNKGAYTLRFKDTIEPGFFQGSSIRKITNLSSKIIYNQDNNFAIPIGGSTFNYQLSYGAYFDNLNKLHSYQIYFKNNQLEIKDLVSSENIIGWGWDPTDKFYLNVNRNICISDVSKDKLWYLWTQWGTKDMRAPKAFGYIENPTHVELYGYRVSTDPFWVHGIDISFFKETGIPSTVVWNQLDDL